MKRSPLSVIVFILIALGVGVWWVYLQFLVVHTLPINFLFNAAYAVPFFVAGGIMLRSVWGWRHKHVPESPIILLILLSLVFYGFAQLAWTYNNFTFGVEVPEFSLADVFYISSVLLQLMGAGSLLVHQVRKQPSKLAATGFYIFIAVLASFASAYGLFSVLKGLQNSRVITLESFYTTVSFFTIFATIFAINRDKHGEMRPFLYLFFVSAVAHAGADFFFALRARSELYWNGDFVDGMYAMSALFVYYAALCLPASLDHSAKEEYTKDRWGSFLLPIAILLVGLLAAVQVGDFLFVDRQHQLQNDADMAVERYVEIVQKNMQVHIASVLAVAGFIEGDEQITEEEFKKIIQVLHIDETLPDLRLYFVGLDHRVVFSEKPSIIGLDVFSDPQWQLILEETIASTKLVISKPVPLVSRVPGILLMKSVYKDGVYVGTVVGTVRLSELMTALHAFSEQEQLDIQLLLSESIVSSDGLAVFNLAFDPIFLDPSLTEKRVFVPFHPQAIMGRAVFLVGTDEWQLDVGIRQDRQNSAYTIAISVFLGVFTLIFALAMVVYLLTSQRVRLREQLEMKTRSLKKSISDLSEKKSYLDSVSDAVVVRAGSAVLYKNAAAVRLFGTENGHKEWPYNTINIDRDEVHESLVQKHVFEGEGQTGKKDLSRDVLVSVRMLAEDGRRGTELLLARDITDRKNIERAKTQFVSLVAHQLRTPMTQLRWMVETMEGSKRLSAHTRETLEDMHAIILKENQFVGDLLNVSRIERGVLKLNTGNVGVEDLLKKTVSPLLPLVKERKIYIIIEDIPRTARIHVDEEKTIEALRNLVDNAVKYAPVGSTVTLDAVRNRDAWEVRVTDQGAGIPDELQSRLFDIKTSISVSSNQNASSTGLGLYLTKKFIEGMGGTIRFETSSKGTTFFVQLPSASKESAA